MKAAVFKGPGKPLVIETLPDPTPGPNELVLKVHRCGICGTDLHMTDGHAQTFPEGMVIGHEFSGEVVAVGPGVEGFRNGDHVAAMPVVGCGQCGSCLSGEPMWCEVGFSGLAGGFGQYAIARANAAIRLPATLSVEDGALIEPMAVSLHGVNLAEIKPGSRVLVLGSGPIGLGSAWWSRKLGAARVAVVSRSRRSEALAQQMGASHFFTFGEELPQQLAAALGGPPDVVFECIGVPGMVAQAVNLVRPRGTVVIMGNCMLPDTFYPAQAMFKQVRIQGSMVYSRREFEIVADTFDAGSVEPRATITGTLGFEELPTGFEALRTPTTQCKVMVMPWL